MRYEPVLTTPGCNVKAMMLEPSSESRRASSRVQYIWASLDKPIRRYIFAFTIINILYYRMGGT